MPIDGFPDPKVHKFCPRCARWHESDEGSYVSDGVWRPLDWMRARVEVETLKKKIFVCNRCLKRRRTVMGIVVALFALAVVGIGACVFYDLFRSMSR